MEESDSSTLFDGKSKLCMIARAIAITYYVAWTILLISLSSCKGILALVIIFKIVINIVICTMYAIFNSKNPIWVCIYIAWTVTSIIVGLKDCDNITKFLVIMSISASIAKELGIIMMIVVRCAIVEIKP